ncbi:MAG TPA: tetratricopeptide repeat protein [Cyclobacteriaceae bacterium]|nr:tetratricopeptide repeat protein [Cyclobacteriaceae bacterium]HRJ83563.1 tetratricopeptide repeat protein [Cyclobacteriaceae bacterium]
MNMARGWITIALICWVILQVTYAQTPLPDSLSRFSKIPQDSNYVIALNKLATDVLRHNPIASRRIGQHVSEIARAIQFTKGYARALTVIGNSYWSEGVFELAQEYYFLAAREYQVAGDSVGWGQTYNNIGEVYKRLGEPQKALEFLLHSIELKKKDLTTRAITYYNIGELYYGIGDLKTAVTYFENSLSQALRDNNKRVIAYNYMGFGLVNLKQKKYESALDYFVRAEKILKEIGEIRMLILVYHHLTDTYRKLKLFERAERYLNLANEMAAFIKATDLMVVNYSKKAELDSARGDYAKALQNLYRYNTLKDSVYNLNKAEQIARLQMVYQTEMQEAENRQLRFEKNFREVRLRQQQQIIIAITIGLLIAGILAWVLLVQRRRILTVNALLKSKNDEIQSQKMAIELQASTLKKLNEDLQELNKNLETRIDERTRQLTLQNQKLTEYTFVNAHKLRAPVASVLGLISLMHQADANEKEIIYQHLKTCAEQLDTITREISRTLEAGIIENE